MISMPTSDMDLNSLALAKSSQDKGSQLGQEDFLMLMVEQFRNQDPFQPMENGQFIAQMAQFSSVAGISEMNQSMAKLADTLSSNQALQASTMVGRTVLADGNLSTLGSESPLQGGVQLPYATNAGFVRIYDGMGAMVRELPLGNRPAGVNTFQWDGLLADGERAPAGTYRIAGGLRNGGTEEALSTYVGTRVQSVMLSAGGRSAEITTEGGQQIGLSQIKAIM